MKPHEKVVVKSIGVSLLLILLGVGVYAAGLPAVGNIIIVLGIVVVVIGILYSQLIES